MTVCGMVARIVAERTRTVRQRGNTLKRTPVTRPLVQDADAITDEPSQLPVPLTGCSNLTQASFTAS